MGSNSRVTSHILASIPSWDHCLGVSCPEPGNIGGRRCGFFQQTLLLFDGLWVKNDTRGKGFDLDFSLGVFIGRDIVFCQGPGDTYVEGESLEMQA